MPASSGRPWTGSRRWPSALMQSGHSHPKRKLIGRSPRFGAERESTWGIGSVKYKVIIPPEIRSRVSRWGLTRKVLLNLLNCLHIDVASDPSSYLAEPVYPYA